VQLRGQTGDEPPDARWQHRESALVIKLQGSTFGLQAKGHLGYQQAGKIAFVCPARELCDTQQSPLLSISGCSPATVAAHRSQLKLVA